MTASTVALLVLMTACSSNPPPSPPRIDPSRPVDTLTTKERKQHCDRVRTDTDRVLSERDHTALGCAAKALLAVEAAGPAGDEAARLLCRNVRDECIATADPSPRECVMLPTFARCKKLTVGELDDCTGEMLVAIKARIGVDVCADLQVAAIQSTRTTLDSATRGPKCRAMANKCLER
jgi:hypothetical protein